MRPRLFTPSGFLISAAMLVVLYVILSLCGLRQYTSVLALTVPAGASPEFAEGACVTYLVSYFAAILLAPVLIIAAALWQLVRAWHRG